MNRNRRHICGGCGYRRGFTLMEILVSLAVVATAATIFVSLFGSSLVLSRQNRSQTVAVSLAQEQLEFILQNTSKFVWNLDGAEPGRLIEVVPAEAPAGAAEGAAGHAFDALAVVPVEPGSSAREENFYQKFRWQAYVTLPQADAKHVDLTVVVRWADAGRAKSVALTSSAPRFALGGRSVAWVRPVRSETGGIA